MRPIRTLLLLLPLATLPLHAQGTRPTPTPGRQSPPPAAPAASGALTLQQVRDAFAKADADRSGKLDAAEALAGGLDAAQLAAADADGDQVLNQDEFVVGSEGRAAKQTGGAAADLSAESTRLQALRRAQKSEELKNRRGTQATPPASAPGTTRTGREPSAPRSAAETPATEPAAAPTVNGPAAARRATAAETPADREKRLQEIRDSIARRLRNGELTSEQAQEAYAAIDRRIANALGEAPKAPAAVPAADAAQPTPAADLAAIEESLNRRLRNSELDPAKAKEVFGDVSRRIDNAQGGTAATPAPTGVRRPADAAVEPAAGSAPASLRERVIEAQGDLTRRLRNAELSPEQAAAEKEALRQRTERAVEKARAAAGADSAANGSAAPLAPQPARGRAAESQPVPAPAANPRRAAEAPAPTTPAPSGARGAVPTGTPAAQPAPARPAGQEPQAPVATPARPAPKPANPPAGGGN